MNRQSRCFELRVHLFSKYLLSFYMASPYQLIFFPQKQTQDFIQGYDTSSKRLLLLLSRFSRVSDSVLPHRRRPTRLRRPWDSPGNNTGVGCHFLLQSMKVKSENEVTQSCSTLSDPMDCSPPGFSVHGIFQARVLE